MPNNTQVITRPIKSDCNFNAAGQPICYKLRREDYQFNQINDDTGLAQIQINGTDLTEYFEVDDTVYVEGIGSTTVTASAFSGGNTLVTTDVTFTGTATGYINNNSKRTDYKIEVEVFSSDNESLGPRIVHDPGENGEVIVNVSAIVKTFTSAEWEDVTVDGVEEETSLEFYIKYQEFFDITYWDLVDDVSNKIVAVFATIPMMLGSPPNFTRYQHGGNLLDYCPENDTKQFLTRFDKPTMWRGFPFTLSFLWSVTSINRRVRQLDSENNELADTVTVLTGTESTVHRTRVGDIEDDAKKLFVSLQDGDASGDEPLTEELEIEVRDPCENQILLFWKNSLGGDSWWMFDESQDYEYTYPSGRKVKRLTLFADNLKLNDWDALNELNTVTDVIGLNIVDYAMDDSINKTHFRNDNQVYIVTEELDKVGVVVVANPLQTKTSYKKHAIEITIELPEVFVI